jgi:hypothetical protein
MVMATLVLLLSTVSHAQELITQPLDTSLDLNASRLKVRRVPEPSATVLLLVGLSMIGFGSYCVEHRKRRA